MLYKHALGNFNARISGINYNMPASVTVEQMQKDLAKLNIATAVIFFAEDTVHLKRAAYNKISADVLLTPGYDVVVFDGEKTGDNEILSRYAIDQLKEVLEANLISFAKKNLEAIRTESKRLYLNLARNQFMNMQDSIQAGMDFINNNLTKPFVQANAGINAREIHA